MSWYEAKQFIRYIAFVRVRSSTGVFVETRTRVIYGNRHNCENIYKHARARLVLILPVPEWHMMLIIAPIVFPYT